MNTFELHLESPTQYEKIEGVSCFVGTDPSGKFGLLAHHARMMTCLNFGLSRFTYENQQEEYLAFPGAILYFSDNQLYISARHYSRDKDCHRLEQKMDNMYREEEESLRSIKASLRQLDEEILKRLLALKRWGNDETK